MIDEEITLNYFFLGICESRDDPNPTLLTQFANALKTKEKGKQETTVIFDGPGSAPHRYSVHPTPGTYTYNTKTGEKNDIYGSHFLDAVRKEIKRLSGIVDGDGVEDNLLEAVSRIEQIVKLYEDENKKLKIKLNLTGFSRGGDTTLRLANILNALYGNKIEVNIFALDPVAGGYARPYHAPATNIPANVREYNSLLMMDETRVGFEPQDLNLLTIERPDKTTVSIEILPGNHFLVQGAPDNPDLRDPSYLAAYKLLDFFNRHGAKLEKPPFIAWENPLGRKKNNHYAAEYNTPEKRLEAFLRMKKHRSAFEKLRGANAAPRNLLYDRERYVRDSDYFITQQEREDFKAVYPDIFDWFFQGGYDFYVNYRKNHHKDPDLLALDNKRLAIYQALSELKLSKIPRDQQIFDSLQKRTKHLFKTGIPVFSHTSLMIPFEPQGLFIEERSKNTKHLPWITSRLEYLSYKINEIILAYQKTFSWLFQGFHNDDTSIALQILKNFTKHVLSEKILENEKVHLLEEKLSKISQFFEENNIDNSYAQKIKLLAAEPQEIKIKRDQVSRSRLPENTSMLHISPAIYDSCRINIIKTLEAYATRVWFFSLFPWANKEQAAKKCKIIKQAIGELGRAADTPEAVYPILTNVRKKSYTDEVLKKSPKGERGLAKICTDLIQKYGLDILSIKKYTSVEFFSPADPQQSQQTLYNNPSTHEPRARL